MSLNATDQVSQPTETLPNTVQKTTVGDCGHLLYRGFSLVWFDLFPIRSPLATDGKFAKPYDDDIDREIFDQRFLASGRALRRFRLDNYRIRIRIDESPTSPIVEGEVRVRAACFFGETVCLTHRLIVTTDLEEAESNGYCKATRPLSTDDLILLAGMPSAVENWHVDTSEHERSTDGTTFTMQRPVSACDITGLSLDQSGAEASDLSISGRNDALQAAFSRYRRHFTGGEDELATRYWMVDIWESLAHSEPVRFSEMNAGEIVEHIDSRHRAELMGLLTLYPYEWPYRDARAYKRVCGENIAIDTDDLVLATDGAALVLGTYGIRGAGNPIDWKAVLQSRREYDVSWPEYLHILEIVVAKLHTINSAHASLQITSLAHTSARTSELAIQETSGLALRVNQTILNMNAVTFSRYASHKLMYRETEERVGFAEDLEQLTLSLSQIDRAIKNLDSIEQGRRAWRMTTILLAVTLASLFQIVFQPVSVPLFADNIAIRMIGHELARPVARGIIGFITLCLGIIMLTAPVYWLLTLISRHRPRWIKRRRTSSVRL